MSLQSPSYSTKSAVDVELSGVVTNESNSPGKATAIEPDPFTKELNRLQDEQICYIRKLEKEKLRKELLREDLERVKIALRIIQEKTKNGNIAKDFDVINKKKVARLEHGLQSSKIKLSVARNENAVLKRKIQDLRRDKMLHLQILADLGKEAHEIKKKIKQGHKELLVINDKKHKAKMGIVNIKHTMIRDMEEFSRELYTAKQHISQAQQNILGTIRTQIKTANTRNSSPGGGLEGTSKTATPNQQFGTEDFQSTKISVEAIRDRQTEIEALLKETEFSSLDEIVNALQASEEKMFTLYNETQVKNEEMEKVDLENRQMEIQVEEQMKKLKALEGHHDQMKQDLEKNIQSLVVQITKYDQDYNKNMELLQSIAENLTNLLKNVAVDHAALDQQLLSTGVTDRNVDEYLGLIEQRIDDLIQMSKAAHHQALKRDDFMKANTIEKPQAFQSPALPSLQDTQEEDDDNDGDVVKVNPVDIATLKDLMWKKVQKLAVSNKKNSMARELGMSLSSPPSKLSVRMDSSNRMNSGSFDAQGM